MSDAYSFVKCEDERIKDFNGRIQQCCKENHVTDAQINVVDGQPVITLLCVDPEDLDSEEDQDPLAVLVAKISAVTESVSAKSEEFMGKLFEIADEHIVDVQFAVGPGHDWVTATDLLNNTKPAYMYAEVVRHSPDFGAEFGDNASKGFRPVAGKGSDPKASLETAARRQDTALVKFDASYALVAYLTPAEEEDGVSDTEKEEATAEATTEGDKTDG